MTIPTGGESGSTGVGGIGDAGATTTTTGTSGTTMGGTGSTGDTASGLKQEASQAGQRVGGVAKEEVRHVRREAATQARKLAGQVRGELTGQAGQQQKRAASGLRSVSEQLQSMAESSQQGGATSDMVRTVAGRLGDAASWLDSREPGSLVEEVKTFARRHPGAFIAIAAGAGAAVGRLARAIASGGEEAEAGTTPTTTYATTPPMTDAGTTSTDPLYQETQRTIGQGGEYLP